MNATDALPPLREVIRRYELSARKSLGQNFLLDLNLTGRIARAAKSALDRAGSRARCSPKARPWSRSSATSARSGRWAKLPSIIRAG
jgi:hypothetical protein